MKVVAWVSRNQVAIAWAAMAVFCIWFARVWMGEVADCLLSVLLPFWRDHHAEARKEWIREQGQGAHIAEKWLLAVCVVGILGALAWPFMFGGAA